MSPRDRGQPCIAVLASAHPGCAPLCAILLRCVAVQHLSTVGVYGGASPHPPNPECAEAHSAAESTEPGIHGSSKSMCGGELSPVHWWLFQILHFVFCNTFVRLMMFVVMYAVRVPFAFARIHERERMLRSGSSPLPSPHRAELLVTQSHW